MRYFRLVIIIGLAFSAAFALSMTTFRSAKLGFELRHPSDWKVTTTSTLARFKSPDTEGEFSVGVLKFMPLEVWVKLRKAEEVLPDGSSRVESSKDVRLAGRAAKRIVLFGFDRYVAEEAVIASGRLYVISYDSSNPNDPKFAQHQTAYQTMRSSLKFR